MNDLNWEDMKRDFYLDCLHHFKLDINNDMYHMRFSGTEPSLVILGQTK